MLQQLFNQMPQPREISALLRGELAMISAWTARFDPGRFAMHLATIVVGSGCYGAAMGWWRDPWQALYIAIKLPLIMLLTTAGNALINGMLAPLLGLNISFRQSFSVILMSQTIFSAILGAFSPLVAFLIWNSPAMAPTAASNFAYSIILLTHVAVIALAGVTGNIRLFQVLVKLAGGKIIATRVLLAWLAGNLFLGSQLSWILRPFIGSPTLPVEFYRETALNGNFFEAVFHAFLQLFQ